MSENEEPDWLTELAKGGEALRRQMEAIVQAAEQFAANRPARPLARRITRAVDAALHELTSAPEPVVHNMTFHAGLATASAVALAPTITAVGSIVLPKMRVSGQITVQNRVRGQAERDIGYILALVLLWLVVLAVPAAVMATDLSPGAQVMLDAYDAILAELAVKITFRVLDKRE